MKELSELETIRVRVLQHGDGFSSSGKGVVLGIFNGEPCSSSQFRYVALVLGGRPSEP